MTHRGFRQRQAWDQMCEGLDVPVELVHRDERDDATTAATGSELPAVLAEAGGQLIVLLGPAELGACAKDVSEFERRLRDAAASHELTLA